MIYTVLKIKLIQIKKLEEELLLWKIPIIPKMI